MKIKFIIFTILLFTGLHGCQNTTKKMDSALNAEIENHSDYSKKTFEPNQEFNDYWYSNTAEIASYTLKQARYGEMREGTAVLIYVTEDFLKEKQVKADQQAADNISVLKLNATKNFNTGIYPYAIMQSSFYPVSNNQHALKLSCSIQEWCGQAYTQLNNLSNFEIESHSYFQSEGDQKFKIKKDILENEIWTQLRINPKSLPTGSLKIIPSLEYIRLKHQPLKAYEAFAELTTHSYTISYINLNRTLTINFNPNFPYDIESWEERFESGFGSNTQLLTTRATRLKLITSAYWTKNANKDIVLRDTLKLN